MYLPRVERRSQKFYIGLGENLKNSPLWGAEFVVNSEPHTGVRPSARLCAGLIMDIEGYQIHISPSYNSPIEKRYTGYAFFSIIAAGLRQFIWGLEIVNAS